MTMNNLLELTIKDNGKVTANLGLPIFEPEKIPFISLTPAPIHPIETPFGRFDCCVMSLGNPHCVIPVQDLSPELAKKYGPLLEVHPLFPNRTNVQFLKVLDRNNIEIEIWERGAGYTLASGSSSSAAAAVARKLGLCDSQITVHMPGGEISISVDEDFGIIMVGSVTRIAEGQLADEMFE